jgi:excisionase family DNA binding protein
MQITPHSRIEDLPQFLTVAELRTSPRLGRSCAYDLIRQGIMPAVRFGRTVRVPKEGLLRYVSTDK